RVVKVFRDNDSESPKSRTKNTHLMSVSSMATTLPEVFNNSNLPSRTKCAEATYPFKESRSALRTITFLWVEGMEKLSPESFAHSIIAEAIVRNRLFVTKGQLPQIEIRYSITR